LRSLKPSISHSKFPKETNKYEIEETMKKIVSVANCRLGIMSEFRDGAVSDEREMLKRIKVGIADWPSEWLLQEYDSPPKQPT